MQKIIVRRSIIIDYFRVAPNLCFKTRLSGKPMIWKYFFILMEMKLVITRKALYLALFWKLGLWNTEMAFRSMKHEIHYLYPWFAGFIPDEFANLCVIRALKKWKQSLLSPYLRWLDPVFWGGTILLWSSLVSPPLSLIHISEPTRPY